MTTPSLAATDETAPKHGAHAVQLWIAGLSLAAIHVFLVNYYVPFREIFSDRPLRGGDFDLHIGQVYRVLEGLQGWGRSWVYDVRLLAGQPEGAITDAGSKGWELWTYVVHSMGARKSVAFNSFVLLVMLGSPILTYAACRVFELGPGASLLGAAMASTLWFFDSHVHWIWFAGMVSWAGASCLSLLTLALFYRLIHGRRMRFALPCAVCLGVGHLIHPYTFFAIGAPMAALYLRSVRQLPPRIQLSVLGIVLFTLGLNAYWLRVSAAHWHYILDSAYYAQGRIDYFYYDFLGILRSGVDTGVIGARTGFRFLYLALAVAGLVALWRRRDPRCLPLVTGIMVTLTLAYCGSYLSLTAQVQPYRNITPAMLLTTIPAAAFVAELVHEREWARLTRGIRALLIVAAVVVFQHLMDQVLYFTPRELPDPARFAGGTPSPLTKYGFLTRIFAPTHLHYGVPHVRYLELDYQSTQNWLEAHVPEGGRVLVEGGVLGERLAWQSKLEVIGGFLERNVAHAYANYFRRFANQRISPRELSQYLRTYAIGWVAAVRGRSEFDEATDVLELVASTGGYRIYRTLQPVSVVLQGSGQVRAATNLIEVSGSDPEQPLVLSYHFDEALRCQPGCVIERQLSAYDSVGLIRIPAPHARDLRIFNAYP